MVSIPGMQARFKRRTVHILGGGPSLADLDLSVIKADPVIAVNNAGLDVMPRADILFVMDRRWWDWNRDRLSLNHSGWRCGRQFHGPSGWDAPWPIIEFPHDKFGDLSPNASRLAGTNGGAMAINLAYVLRASTIVLHGFDMRPGNYHADHQTVTNACEYPNTFIPSIERMAAALEGKIDVYNATPGSALTCFKPWRFPK